MTMMTSLKALLFSTAAGPAGTNAAPAATEDMADFAAMLEGMASKAAPALPTLMPDRATPALPAILPDQTIALPEEVGTDISAAAPDLPLPTVAILTGKVPVAPVIAPIPQPVADAEAPETSIDFPAAPSASAPIKPDMAAPMPFAPEAIPEAPLAPEDAGSDTDEPVKDEDDAQPIPAPPTPVVTVPVIAPLAQAAPQPAPEVSRDVPAVPIAAQAPIGSAPMAERDAVAAPADGTTAIVPPVAADTNVPASAEPRPAPMPAATAAPSAKAMDKAAPITELPVKAAVGAEQPVLPSVRPAKTVVQQLPLSPDPHATANATATTSTPAAPVVPGAIPVAPPAIATAEVPTGMVETQLPLPAEASLPQPKGMQAAAPRAEAVSLLQFVRDHLSARATPSTTEPAAMAASEPAAAPMPDTGITATSAATPNFTTAITPQPSPAAAAIAAPSVATPDLSASLGAQVVDMGVQGQWIDGLAREIAGLSAHGAQGRFQIDTQQLGPVQVAIRQDADGAAISLTVASQAAEDALRQDSDRLRLDAGLQAIRINEVKIERAPHIAEAARTDTQNQQQSNQQNSQHGQQSAWQAQGQNLGQNANQSAQQGRWQGRENISGNLKGGGDASVLTRADAGESTRDGPRARYA